MEGKCTCVDDSFVVECTAYQSFTSVKASLAIVEGKVMAVMPSAVPPYNDTKI